MTVVRRPLDRDLPKVVPPTEKPCKACGTVKPNNFMHFGKKISGSRTTFTTLDVCKVCRNARISGSMKRSWNERRGTTYDPVVSMVQNNPPVPLPELPVDHGVEDDIEELGEAPTGLTASEIEQTLRRRDEQIK